MDASEVLGQFESSHRDEFYSEADVDAHAESLIVHPDAGTVDCPVCQGPVSASEVSRLARYGSTPDFTTGWHRRDPSPSLFILSCGHRIELPAAT